MRYGIDVNLDSEYNCISSLQRLSRSGLLVPMPDVIPKVSGVESDRSLEVQFSRICEVMTDVFTRSVIDRSLYDGLREHVRQERAGVEGALAQALDGVRLPQVSRFIDEVEPVYEAARDFFRQSILNDSQSYSPLIERVAFAFSLSLLERTSALTPKQVTLVSSEPWYEQVFEPVCVMYGADFARVSGIDVRKAFGAPRFRIATANLREAGQPFANQIELHEMDRTEPYARNRFGESVLERLAGLVEPLIAA